MMLIARSAAKIYSDSKPISGLPDSFRALAGDVAGVPVLVIVVAILYLVAHFVLTRTKLGRYSYAIGGNEQAAWLSGVPVVRIQDRHLRFVWPHGRCCCRLDDGAVERRVTLVR